MKPIDLELREQLSFLSGVLPRGSRILDAGCGRGELASRLVAGGYEVVAIDSDPEAVGAARAVGIPVVHADFTTYEDARPFDAVVFSRSLHHIQPLAEAIVRAHALLRGKGLLIADEFGCDWADRQTAGWFYDTLSLLEIAGVLEPSHRVPPAPDDPLERWKIHHEETPPMHGGDAMVTAIAERFEILSAERGPYLYCYLGGWLEESDRGLRLARRLLASEQRQIESGHLAATGVRVVAQRR